MENVKLLPIKLEPAPIVKDNIENNIDIWLQNEVGMLYQNESQLLKTEDKINKGEFLLIENMSFCYTPTYTHMYKKISTKHIINKLKTTNYKYKYRLGK